MKKRESFQASAVIWQKFFSLKITNLFENNLLFKSWNKINKKLCYRYFFRSKTPWKFSALSITESVPTCARKGKDFTCTARLKDKIYGAIVYCAIGVWAKAGAKIRKKKWSRGQNQIISAPHTGWKPTGTYFLLFSSKGKEQNKKRRSIKDRLRNTEHYCRQRDQKAVHARSSVAEPELEQPRAAFFRPALQHRLEVQSYLSGAARHDAAISAAVHTPRLNYRDR